MASPKVSRIFQVFEFEDGTLDVTASDFPDLGRDARSSYIEDFDEVKSLLIKWHDRAIL